MCGICGSIKTVNEPVDTRAIEAMKQVITPRGPDSEGSLQTGHIGFGHRRLKIIDLSDAAQQPMSDAKLGLSIVYNGAIYNYPELRKQFVQEGYEFFSTGDTEVILKAYHKWGKDCVKHLNGMFAFAIYEHDTGRVMLARDRLGIKPLYYTQVGNEFRFASSLPALVKAGGVDKSIDPIALNYYMSFHAVVPPPHTLLNGVRKLRPGHTMMIKPDGTRTEESYWDLTFGATDDQKTWTDADWQAATLEVMRRSVKRRLVADVPVGVLLSGGLDSSLIVGLLCEHNPDAVETFSIGFESVNNEAGDEFKYSDVIVERFKTRHHKLFIDAAKTLPALRECIGHMSEPMVSHDNVGFYLLSQEVAKFVKVVQSGQGADEIFGGYHWYPPMLDNSADALTTYAGAFFDRDYAEYQQVVLDQWHRGDHALDFVRTHFAQPGAPRNIDKALRIDSQVMLVDDPVKRVDNNTMAASLEARVPFLDHEVVEFAAQVPGELKIRDGGKYILKEASRQVIPAEVIDRPKGYFPVPALKYLRGTFLDFAKESLLNDTARNRGLLNPAYVDKLIADPESHITRLQGSKLWQLSLLEHWLQTHEI